jgi:hypothetical protein
MNKALVLVFLSIFFSAQAQTPATPDPKGKPCSEMTADSTKLEKSRCIKDTSDPCDYLTVDATDRSKLRCAKRAAQKASAAK